MDLPALAPLQCSSPGGPADHPPMNSVVQAVMGPSLEPETKPHSSTYFQHCFGLE